MQRLIGCHGVTSHEIFHFRRARSTQEDMTGLDLKIADHPFEATRSIVVRPRHVDGSADTPDAHERGV